MSYALMSYMAPVIYLYFKQFWEEAVIHPQVLRGPFVGLWGLTGIVFSLKSNITKIHI